MLARRLARARACARSTPLPSPHSTVPRRLVAAAAKDIPVDGGVKAARGMRGLVKLLTISSAGILGTAGAGYSYYQRLLSAADPSTAALYSSSPTSYTSSSSSSSSSPASEPSSDQELLSLLRRGFPFGGADEFDALCEVHADEMDQIINEFIYTASQLEQLGRLHEEDALEPYYHRFHDKVADLLRANAKLLAAVESFEKALAGARESAAAGAEEAMAAVERTDVFGAHAQRPSALRDAIAAFDAGTLRLAADARAHKGGNSGGGGGGGFLWSRKSRIAAAEEQLGRWKAALDLGGTKPDGNQAPEGD